MPWTATASTRQVRGPLNLQRWASLRITYQHAFFYSLPPFPWTNAPRLAKPITVIQNMQGQTCFGPPTDPQLKINPSLLMARSSQRTKKKHKVLAVIGEPGHSAAGPLSWCVSTALGWVRWWEVTCRFLPDQSMRRLHPLFRISFALPLPAHYPLVGATD